MPSRATSTYRKETQVNVQLRLIIVIIRLRNYNDYRAGRDAAAEQTLGTRILLVHLLSVQRLLYMFPAVMLIRPTACLQPEFLKCGWGKKMHLAAAVPEGARASSRTEPGSEKTQPVIRGRNLIHSE